MEAQTKYAKSGDVHIAYRVLGDGPRDIVLIPGTTSHVELFWEFPPNAHLLRRLASFARVIVFDKRGQGLSDRVAEQTLEERIGDVLAVMDAADSERATICGWSEGGAMSLMFSATYPERTSALVLFGAYASMRADPWAIAPEQFEVFLATLEERWGQGILVPLNAPSRAKDEAFVRWWAQLERAAASPGAIVALFRANYEIDVRHTLPSIHVPTLILHRVGDALVPVRAGRYLAENIPGAKYVELPGADHLLQAFEEDVLDLLLDEIEEFITGTRQRPEPDRALATLMFTHVVGSTEPAAEVGDRQWRELLNRFYTAARKELTGFRGHEVNTTGDGLLATFDGPARAIRCACSIRERVGPLGLQVRTGLHTGECELIGDDVGGIALHIAAGVAATARPGEVLVSRTVKDLVAGSRLNFADRGTYRLKGLPDDLRLYAVQSALTLGASESEASGDPHTTKAVRAAEPQSFASGRYVVSRLLGEGGQKIVFLARDTQLGRDVAVALLKAEGLEEAGLARLRREAQALARLEAQPNIVAIYDIGDHEGRPFTVCEYLAGGTLEQEVARAGGALPAERATAIARDVCRALIVAHGGDIIHRDIKPSNIWLTGAGSAKLGDFGLATALDRSRVTQAGTIMGTAAYMAPEQALGGEIDQRSDVYSLGCVLYEMLTGRPPFVANTAVAVVSQHINASPVPPSDLQPGLPRALERLVMQMLAKAPEDRPQTAAEVLAALEGNAPTTSDAPARVRASPVVTEPQVRYCTTEDGVRIAYTVTGEGPAHLFINEPMVSHVQLERDVPLFKRITDRLVSANTLIRFDPRGVGMSDRVLPTTLEESALDIRAVVDRLGLNQFALTGVQSSVLPVLFYTAHNVSQIRRVVLLDGFLRARDPSDAVQSRALASAASVDFEMATEMVGAAVFGPGREESRSYGIYIRSCIGPEFFGHAPVAATFDATPYTSAVTVPALVIRHDGLQYITPEMTRDLVSRLPDARLITVPGLWADNPEGLADHVVAFIDEDE